MIPRRPRSPRSELLCTLLIAALAVAVIVLFGWVWGLVRL
jgi:hypothetical protein